MFCIRQCSEGTRFEPLLAVSERAASYIDPGSSSKTYDFTGPYVRGISYEEFLRGKETSPAEAVLALILLADQCDGEGKGGQHLAPNHSSTRISWWCLSTALPTAGLGHMQSVYRPPDFETQR